MDQGFAPTVKVARPHSSAATLSHGQGVATAKGAINEASSKARSAAQQEQATLSDRTLNGLQAVQGGAFKVVNYSIFGGMFGGGLLGGLINKVGLKKTSVVVKSVFSAPSAALHKTTFGDLHQYPANVMRAVSDIAGTEVGGSAASWAKPAADMADRLSKHGKDVAARGSVVGDAVKSTVGAGLDRFATTGAGKQVDGMLNRVTGRYAAHLDARHGKALEKASAAFTQEVPGFWAKMKNAVLRRQPATIGVAPEFKGAMDFMAKGKLQEAAEAVVKVAGAEGASADLATRGGHIAEMIGKAMHSEQAAKSYGNAAQQGLKGAMRAVMQSAKKVPLFTAIIGTGIVAGTAATLLMTRKENSMAKETLAQLERDLGGNQSPLYVQAAQLTRKQNSRRWLSAGLNTAGQGVTINQLQSFTPSLMIAEMALQNIGPMLVPENPVLNAYASLKAVEEGKIQATAEQRSFWTTQLLATVPEVAANHGVRNKLAQSMAQELVAENKGTKAVLAVITDPQAFVGMADRVAKKQQQVTQPAAKANDNDTATRIPQSPSIPAVVANDNPAPLTKITAAAGTSQGRVTQGERALG